MGPRRVEMVTWKWPQNNDGNVISPQVEPTVSNCKDECIIPVYFFGKKIMDRIHPRVFEIDPWNHESLSSCFLVPCRYFRCAVALPADRHHWFSPSSSSWPNNIHMRLAVLLWELCLIRHKPSYKIQFSLYRPLSFQYTSINRQRLINVSPFKQSKKTITIFRNHIRDETKFFYSSRHSLHYEKRVFSPRWLVNFILSHAIAKDGSRIVIPLSERKMFSFYWKDKERIEFYKMVYDECSTVRIIKRQKWILYRQN